MSIPIKDFWKLAVDGRLVSVDEARQLHGSFARMPGASKQGNAVVLAEWLVSSGVMTRYQTQLLLGGNAGPFVFGEFKLREPAGAGRLEGLFHAIHVQTGHPVLLSFLSGPATQDPRTWAGVVREGQVAAAARHPHLCRLYEVVDLPDYKFAVLEDLTGATIGERLAGRATVPGEACRIVRDTAAGLAKLHEQRVAHGEIRPTNIWVDDTGTVKLLHFPLARDPLAPPVMSPEAADYAAPEVAARQVQRDPLADLYSLGCTLYQLIAGRPPFPGGDVNQKLARHCREMPPPLESLVAVPPGVAQLVNYLMAKDPRSRYQAAAHVVEALGPFVVALPNSAPPASPTLAAFEQYLAKPKSNGAAPVPPRAAPAAQKTVAPAVGQASATTAPPAPAAQRSAAQPAASGAVAGAVPAAKPAAAPPPTRSVTPQGGFGTAERPINTEIAPEFGGLPPIRTDLVKGGTMVLPKLDAKAGASKMQPLSPPSGLNTVPSLQPKKGISNETLTIIGVSAAVILMFIGFLVWKNSNRPVTDDPGATPEVAQATTTTTTEPAVTPTPEEAVTPDSEAAPENSNEVAVATPPKKPAYVPPPKPQPVLIEDDKSTLWASPTSGEPLNFSYLPPGGQVFFAVRPKELFGSQEGEKMLAALGPSGKETKSWLEGIAGVSSDADPVEQVIVGLYPQEMGAIKMAMVVWLSEPMEEASLVGRWKDPAPQQNERGIKFFKNDSWAYYIPPAGGGKVFAIMPPSEIVDVMASDEPPALRKEMEKLLRDTDSSRHFTLLANPSYTFTDGAAIFAGNLQKIQKPLQDFLGDGVQAALLSAHLAGDFFVEMRAYGSLDEDPFKLAEKYRAKLAKLPGNITNYYVTLNPHPYGRVVLTQFPMMIFKMEEFTRTGEENKQAVLRCYLPLQAGHNLVMGAELAMAETPGAGPATVVAAAGPKAPTSPAEALQQKISLSFPRDTLEKTMIYLGEEVKWEVHIEGKDLQLEGITKNQSFGLDERDKTAGEILRKVMKLANPDGKLIYVFRPVEAGGKDVIFITTRAGAAKRGDKIPPELN